MSIHPRTKLNQYVVARWNSTVTMLVSVLDLNEQVLNALGVMHRQELEIGGADWPILQESLRILTPFHHMTGELSSQKYPSLSTMIYYYKRLHTKQNLFPKPVSFYVRSVQTFFCDFATSSTEVETLRVNLQTNFNRRFGKCESCTPILTSTFLYQCITGLLYVSHMYYNYFILI